MGQVYRGCIGQSASRRLKGIVLPSNAISVKRNGRWYGVPLVNNHAITMVGPFSDSNHAITNAREILAWHRENGYRGLTRQQLTRRGRGLL
jgi:hypothetical protein